jgi:predicted RNA-binding protein with PUA-like domain
MAFWLFKEEPSHYSFADLERDGSTVWSGIRNTLAKNHLRRCRRDDQVFLYHTGGEKAIVGVARVTAGHDPKLPPEAEVTATIVPVRRLGRPVALAQIKAEPTLAGWDLVRLSRLSVLPVEPSVWAKVLAMAGETAR